MRISPGEWPDRAGEETSANSCLAWTAKGWVPGGVALGQGDQGKTYNRLPRKT